MKMEITGVKMPDKKFKLSDKFVEKYQKIKPPFGFNGLGELVYMRTYSRIKSDGDNEQWWETIRRVVEGTYRMQQAHIENYRLGWDPAHAQRSAQEMYDRMFHMKFLPPGRGLWAMGTPVVEEKGLTAALLNCAFISTENMHDNPTEPFTWLMDASMLGVGVGYDVKGAGSFIIKGINPKRPVTKFVITDDREGWVESVGMLLDHIFSGRGPIEFDYSQIRVAGLPIKGFGGVAAGPEPLRQLHDRITKSIQKCAGEPISVRNIVDIQNMIGACVVAGNIRRSAEIVFGEPGDQEYLDLKNYKVNPDREEYGWTSNNSIFAELGMDYKEAAERTKINGEPGYIWLENIRGYSRMNNGKDNKDSRASGTNPCVEQSLESKECCCVSADTRIQTRDGSPRISDTVGKEVEVWNGDKWSKVIPFIAKENQTLYRVHLSDGSYLDCTDDHGWHVLPWGKRVFRKMETKELPIGAQSVEFSMDTNGTGTYENNAYEWGLFTGDGYMDSGKSMLCIYGEKEALKDMDVKCSWYKPQVIEGMTYPCNRGNLSGVLDKERSIYINDKSNGLPDWVFSMSPDSIREFVAGWIETDGNVCQQVNTDNFRIFGGEKKIRDLQILLRRIGINHSTIHEAGAEGEETNKGIRNYSLWCCYIPSYECHDIPTKIKVASRFGSRYKINNAHPEGQKIDAARKQKIIRIEKLEGLHTTYCFTEPENHMGVFGNVMTYQCLVETFPDKHDDIEDYKRTLKFAYLYAKTVTLGNTHWPETNRVMLRNRRIGCSMSGIAQFVAHRGLHELKNWCEDGYKAIQEWDQIYSDWLAVPKSIKTTSVKPSGSVSLVAGATPGIHHPESRFYIRRVRLAIKSPLVAPLKKAGYKVEPCIGQEDSTLVVEIPVDCGDKVRKISDLSVWEQFCMAAFMQKYWADNQVSCSIYFDPEKEGDQIEHCLNHFQYMLKGISLLPKHKEGAYKQMPYEEIDEDTYKKMASNLKKVNFNHVAGNEANVERFCDGVSCEIQLTQSNETEKTEGKEEKKA
jgi:ribonucleotide reductase alpha subunit